MLTVTNCKDFLQSVQVKQHLSNDIKWWTNYIFHYSDVKNIANILNTQQLLSREQYQKLTKVTLNDNASSEVIDGTDSKYKNYVRFYFRPLTPTQFHNEGIRAKEEITELNAHCPVPIFLLFDTSMLDDPNYYFSYESLASHYEIDIYQGLNDFKNAPFHDIYSNGSTFGLDGNQIRKHRHAEVITLEKCNLKYLKRIVCRNKAEKETLLYLLDRNAQHLYSSKISIIGYDEFDTDLPRTLFNNKYLQIIDVLIDKDNTEIHFNMTCSYVRHFCIKWLNSNEEVICHWTHDYKLEERVLLIPNLNFLKDKYNIILSIEINSCLVYMNSFSI